MSFLHAFGYNGFKQLNNIDKTIFFCIWNDQYISNTVNKITNDFVLSCSWESNIYFNGETIVIQGYSCCLNHRVHCYKVNKTDNIFKERVRWLGNAVNCFGILTESGKFLVFDVVCNHASSNTSDSDISNFEIVESFKIQKNCSLAGFDSENFLLYNENGKISTIQRDLKSSQFCIISEITFKHAVVQLECGKNHRLILTAGGKVYSWGIGSRGQLGHGTLASHDVPQLVEALDGIAIKKVAAGGWHSVALADTNDLYTWGWNESGQTGFPAPRSMYSSSTQIIPKSDDKYPPDKPAAQVEQDANSVQESAFASPNEFHDYEPVGIVLSPTLLELERYLATKKDDFVSVLDVAAGSRHTAAIVSPGLVVTWGWAKYGQLGQKCCTPFKEGENSPCSRESPHTPGLVRFGVELVAKRVQCGQWNTFVYADNVT